MESALLHDEPLLFEYANHPTESIALPGVAAETPPDHLTPFMRQSAANLPHLSEPETVRHFVRISQWNHNIESGFYPLGSCTMKYNPRINEQLAQLPGLAEIHPDQPEASVQGLLALLFELQQWLGEISGLPAVTLQPAAGAHGELTGMMMIHAYHAARNDSNRTVVLIPDSAHGTNPASAALCGFTPVEIPSAANGRIDLDTLRNHLSANVAALMLTNPNTTGMFESDIKEITDMVHHAGALVYGDGANLNAMVGVARPGDMGIDSLHINVHKTFATPHGGGGPGAGPVAVSAELAPFLPSPHIRFIDGHYQLYSTKHSIGPLLGSSGHSGVLLRAAAYIAAFGRDHLHKIAEDAVLGANYIRVRLQGSYHTPFPGICKHETLFTDKLQNRHGIKTIDIAKALIDYGFHPMTIYFPLIVHGAMLIEPTETESKATLDSFCDAMIAIAKQIESGETKQITTAPHSAITRRLDETRAARQPILNWQSEDRS
ncbi:MAG: aminomethyl-transferring glycine dehydrogenase subunit GcvPB [Mariprofundales bacterium]|nr:aminomethyl-transferring glycine dehydrogenase subunit GcvPB [Mariprofundales bacterium]